MNLLKKLAVVVAASVGWMGAVQATTYELGTLSPTVQQETEFYAEGTTFADIYNFTVGAEYQTVFASAVGTSAEQTSISNLTLTFYSADGSVVGEVSSSNGSLIDLSSAFLSGDYSVHVSGIADGSLGGGYDFSIAAVPEPAEWAMLLAGLAVLGFIAKRKTNGLMAG
jgi:hypothetical protein